MFYHIFHLIQRTVQSIEQLIMRVTDFIIDHGKGLLGLYRNMAPPFKR